MAVDQNVWNVTFGKAAWREPLPQRGNTCRTDPPILHSPLGGVPQGGGVLKWGSRPHVQSGPWETWDAPVWNLPLGRFLEPSLPRVFLGTSPLGSGCFLPAQNEWGRILGGAATGDLPAWGHTPPSKLPPGNSPRGRFRYSDFLRRAQSLKSARGTKQLD